MAYQYNDFDPAELRRRRMLQPPSQVDEAMAPDEEEQNTAYPASVPSVPPVSPTPGALEHYKQLLQRMPVATDYKPSLGRRLGGIVVGLGQGPEAQQEYVQRPFTKALSNWQMALKPTQALAQLEENQTKQQQTAEYNQQRAAALNRNAAAREKIAQSTEEDRKFKQAHTKWEPLTEDEAFRYKKAGQNPPRDFAGEQAARLKAQQEQNAARLASEEKRESQRESNARTIAGMHEGGANARNAARIAASTDKPKTYAPPSPQAQIAAEGQAAKELLRQNPEYKSFVDVDDKGKHQIKGADSLPMSHWYNGITPAQESLARYSYQKFLTELGKKKQEILARPQPGQGSKYSVELVKDEEE